MRRAVVAAASAVAILSLYGALSFRAAVVPAARAAPAGFVYAQGDKLMLDGQPYFAKGINLFTPFTYTQSKFLNTGIPGVELYEVQGFWHNFDAQKIGDEFRYYRDVLGINTVRLFTPSLKYFDANVQYHGWQPWFLEDGSINPTYRDRIVQLIDIAKQNGVRVSLELFHNAGAIDWECRASSGAWSDCSSDTVNATVTDAADARFIEPGTAKEARYFAYLRSLLPYLKDNPGISAYEVGNESLLNWPLNGQGVSPRRDWYQDKMGSFILRATREIRRLDPNHLITEGEVTMHGSTQQGWWAWPSPEFGALNDIHNLNGGQPYTLESFLDFLSPHFYLQDPAFPGPALTEIRLRTTKPVIFGEFGYFMNGGDTLAPPSSNATRLNYFRSIVALPRNPGISGYFPWAPLVPLDLVPGYSVVSLNTPWGDRGIRFPGTPERTVVGASFEFALFTYDAAYPRHQKPLPEAEAYFGTIAPLTNAAAFVSQSVPSTMTAGQSYPVSITLRNSGTRTWDKIGGPGDYLNAYRIKTQNPPDNTTWGPGFVSIPRAPIVPGESATFSFIATAPATPGTYNFQWQMNQGGVGWFGPVTPNVAISVTTPDIPPSAPLPVIVSFRATPPSITQEEAARLIWSTLSAVSCEAADGWSGVRGISGNEEIRPVSTQIYRLTCRNRDGVSVSADATVTVAPPAAPSSTPPSLPAPEILTFRADPATIIKGTQTRIRWETAHASSCTASEGWQGAQGISGSKQVAPPASESYRLTCRNQAGTEITARVTVTVTAPTQPPAQPPAVPPGGTATPPNPPAPGGTAAAPSGGENDLWTLLQNQQIEETTTTAAAPPRFRISVPWLAGIAILVLLGAGVIIFR